MARVADTKHRDLNRALENGSVMSWGEGEGVSLSGSLQKLMAERVTFQLIISVVARSSSAMR